LSIQSAVSLLRSKNNSIIFSLFVLTFVGLFFSRFLLSVSMISMFVYALLQEDLGKTLRQFIKTPAFSLLTVLFFVSLLSYFNTENTDYFLTRIRLKLPFLVLPFAFFSMKQFSEDLFFKIIYFFFALVSIICIVLLVIYLFDFDYYNKIYGAGRIIPTPIQHIRFSLLICVAISSGVYLLFNNYRLKFRWERSVLTWGIGFLFIFLHVLAVRSGLMAIYGVLIYTAVFYLVKKKDFVTGLFILLVLPAFALLAITFIPTIKNKIGYTKYSLEKLAKMEDIRDLSDSRRIGSIYAGLDLGKKNPVLGVGLGDIKDDTNSYLTEHYPGIKDLDLLPHNQFVFYFAVSGFLGLIAFVICAFVPGFYYSSYANYFFMSITIIYFTSFLVEHTIESQLGTASYLLFLLLSLTYLRTKSAADA